MSSVESIQHQELIWRRALSVHHSYELVDKEGSVLGFLNEMGGLNAHSSIEIGSEKLMFVATTFLLPRISIWTVDRKLVAFFEGNRTGTGVLEFVHGKKYLWVFRDPAPQEGLLSDPESGLAIHFFSEKGIGRTKGRVLAHHLGSDSRPAILGLLGWVILALNQEPALVRSVVPKLAFW